MVCVCFFACAATVLHAKNQVSQSLSAQLSKQTNDTARVLLLIELSRALQALRPDSSLVYARQGLDLAQKTGYKKGEADCLNRLGVLSWRNGKYDNALSYLLGSLKLRETINDRSGQLKSLNDIGIVYSDQLDNAKALSYHFKAKRIAESIHDKKKLGVVLANIGNAYFKLNKVDSALDYIMQAYQIQQTINDQDHLPNTLSILGDIHYKLGHVPLALNQYRLSILYAIKTNDHTGLVDTYNSVAELYRKSGVTDSGIYYAVKALEAAKTASYPEGIYHASALLTQIYQGTNEHLELYYLKIEDAAKDSMFNAERIKQVQRLSFNEAIRQQEISEEKRREAEERLINLQLIAIAIFIPFFFLMLLILSKSKTHPKVIEFMGVVSLLLVFEFITLFIHPFVLRISNHLPVIELLLMVVLAAVLVPLHHRLTHWMRARLIHAHHQGKTETERVTSDGVHE